MPLSSIILEIAKATALLPILFLLVMYGLWENGPANIFKRIRDWGGVIEIPDIEGDEVTRKSNGTFLGDVLTCYRCMSPYAAAIVIILAVICGWLSWPIGHLIILWLALAGTNVFIYERFYG